MSRVAEMLRMKYGAPVTRQQVHGWLNPDPMRRTEPRAGVAMALMDTLSEMKRSMDVHDPQ